MTLKLKEISQQKEPVKNDKLPGFKAAMLVLALLAFVSTANAQVFHFSNNDLILGFRKVAPFTESYEVVVDIGGASNYFNLAVGSTIPVPGFSASQLSPGSFTSVNNLSWSVFGVYPSGTAYSGYVPNTLWVSVPRTNNAIQSQVPTRLTFTAQSIPKANMLSIPGSGGATYVSLNLGASNQFNTPTFVRETIATYSGHILSTWMAGSVDPTVGTLQDTWPPTEPNGGNLENVTSGSFSGTQRSDLYEVRPVTTAGGVPVVDPHTGMTNGPAWYIGYFELQTNGTMTFTRQVSSTHNPPPPPTLSIARAGNVSTISFVSSNSSTYTLLFTNSGGLTAPVTTWPSLPGTITGNGSLQSFQDTTTDPIRFYKVKGQ